MGGSREVGDDGKLGILAEQQVTSHTSLDDMLVEKFKKDGETNRRLRIILQTWIMGLLTSEFIILTILIFFQALKSHGFQLNDYVFGIFVNGCLLQTFLLAKPIVKDLFPLN